MRQLVAHAVQLVDGGVEIAMTRRFAPSNTCVMTCADRLTSVATASATAVTKVGDLFVTVAPVWVIFGAIAFPFVDVVRDVPGRLVVPVTDRSRRCAEVIRQYDCRMVFARFHAVEASDLLTKRQPS